MFDQGRLTKVIFALLASMTCGALLLLVVEGKPIKPMAYSLASQTSLTPVRDALGAENGIDTERWYRIEICCRTNLGQLTPDGQLTGSLARQFHFVISDGAGNQDGQIFASQRWYKQVPCQDVPGPYSNGTIRICLLGDPENPIQTDAQACSLDRLVYNLQRQCRIESGVAWR